jgi:hypothetical protein
MKKLFILCFASAAFTCHALPPITDTNYLALQARFQALCEQRRAVGAQMCADIEKIVQMKASGVSTNDPTYQALVKERWELEAKHKAMRDDLKNALRDIKDMRHAILKIGPTTSAPKPP